MSKCNVSTRILVVSNEVAQVMTSVLTHEFAATSCSVADILHKLHINNF